MKNDVGFVAIVMLTLMMNTQQMIMVYGNGSGYTPLVGVHNCEYYSAAKGTFTLVK